jgi:hypothetical protein
MQGIASQTDLSTIQCLIFLRWRPPPLRVVTRPIGMKLLKVLQRSQLDRGFPFGFGEASGAIRRIGSRHSAIRESSWRTGNCPQVLAVAADAILFISARMTHTVQLALVPDGKYWISILEDESGELVCPTFGPFTREQVFHNPLLVGLDDVQAEFLTEMADLNRKARIKGITQKQYPED